MNVLTEGAAEFPPPRNVVSRTEKSPAWMITAGKSGAGIYISCQQRTKVLGADFRQQFCQVLAVKRDLRHFDYSPARCLSMIARYSFAPISISSSG